jgi:hypothetical protein
MSEEEEEEIIEKGRTVGVKYGETKSLGNYESQRMDVFLSQTIASDEPFEPTINELYRKAKEWVIGKLRQEDLIAEEIEIEKSENQETPKQKILKKVKGAKKIDQKRVYKAAGTLCKKCGGIISWDDFPDNKYPVHIDEEGHIIGDGSCPEYEEAK